MDYLLHCSYALYLFSYSVRDILWLRILSVIGTGLLITYNALPEHVNVSPIAWMSLFTVINTVQIVILILERRPVAMTDEQAELYRNIFHTLKPRDFLRFLKVADDRVAKTGEVIIEEGGPVGGVILLTHGRGQIEVDGRVIAHSPAGQFLGEMSYLTGDPASARVSAADDSRYLFWPSERLTEFFAANRPLNAAFIAILGVDLVAKVKERRKKKTS